jgi:pimeloyl-ACP methyl ester carboxylesterase
MQVTSPVQVFTTPCGSGDIVWRRFGTPKLDRAPLVMLHGGSGSWTHFIRNIDALVAAGLELWLPDLPGFGDSAPSPDGPDADAMVRPLLEGLDILLGERLVQQRCDLLGFSFGGLTAGLMLVERPSLARQLVLVGAPAMGVVPQRQFDLKGWRHLADPLEQAEVHRHNLAVLMLYDDKLIGRASEPLTLAMEVHVANVVRDRLPRRRLAHTALLAQSLPKISCPVSVIYGEFDALYKSYIHQLETAYARVTPDFRGMTLVENAGHWVQFERAQAFHEAVLSALKACP